MIKEYKMTMIWKRLVHVYETFNRFVIFSSLDKLFAVFGYSDITRF